MHADEHARGVGVQCIDHHRLALEEVMAHAFRMSALLEQLQRKLEVGSIDRRELPALLLNLSRNIDHAVASNQKPTSQQSVLQGLKKFTRYKDDQQLRPSIMVLMLSIKSACLAGWFKQSEVDELLSNFKCLFDYFLLNGDCWRSQSQGSLLVGSTSNETIDAETFIPMICERYYPRLMLIAPILALIVKPGYEVRGCDFQITSQLAPSTKLRLFVCGMDNVETSACLVTPPLLSFLLNGRGVERRIYLSAAVEAGPQLPSDVTQFLRIGCNFLQVIGDCSARYFVAIAIMGNKQWSSSSAKLQDYVVPSPLALTDDEVIVGASMVSLRCPISHKRIATPVKGISCKHHQAFDYDSYMEINDRRPAWRCPCCNTYVNCTELRLDSQMEKVLKEVDQNVFDVMVNHDGSWAPDMSQGDLKNAYKRNIGQSSGDGSIGQLEGLQDDLINLSDDEDDDGNGQSLEEPLMRQSSPMDVRNVNFVMEDRKPDIRSMLISEAVAGPESVHTSVSTDVANRDVLTNPVLGAIYSPIMETLDQAGSGTATTGTSVDDPSGGLRTTVQTPTGNSTSWSTGNNLVNSSSLPSGSQLPIERPIYPLHGGSSERPIYSQPSRSTVIQALPAPSQFSVPSARARVSPSIQVSTTPVTQAVIGMSSAGQSQSLLSPSLEFEVHTLQQMQIPSPDQSAEIRQIQELRQRISNTNAQRTQDPSQRIQRQSHRASMPQGVVHQVNIRDAHTQQFVGGTSYQSGQVQQNPNSFGQLQFVHQQSGMSGRQSLDPWHRQRLVQQLHYATQGSSSSPRGGSSGGVTPLANGGSLTSASGIPSGGSSQQGLASRIGSHVTYPGGTNTVSNSPVAVSSSLGTDGWVPSLSNWRPAGTPRMRGAVGAVPTSGLSSGVRVGAVPGTVTRTRVVTNVGSLAPVTMSSFVINETTTTTTTTTTSTQWGNHGGFAVSGSGAGDVYNNPGSLSTNALSPDISWPPLTLTSLEASQMEELGVGTHDSGLWIDDSLFMSSSPQGY